MMKTNRGMLNIVYNCDCMDFMRDKPDKYYDLAIVDPPYGIGESKDKSSRWKKKIDKRNGRPIIINKRPYKSKDWDNKPPDGEYFVELLKISKNQFIFGANYFKEIVKPFKTIRRKNYSHFIKNNPYYWIIWDKVNGNSNFNDCEMIWTSLKIKSNIVYYMWCGFLQGISISRGKTSQGNKQKCEIRIHPTQKPVILYKWFLKKYVKPGWTIFDSHVGSGSSRIVCHQMGFDFEGCEIDLDYWQKQEQRYKEFLNNYVLIDEALKG